MRDRYADDLTFRAAGRECQVSALDHEVGPFAAVLERGIAYQRPGQEVRLAEDLETVADAPHEPAAIRKLSDLLHDRGKSRDRSRAEVVAVGKTAGQDDTVAAFEVGVLVPQVLELRTDDLVDNPTAVAVRPRAWKNNHAKLHEWPDLELCRRFAASAAGAKEPTSTRGSAYLLGPPHRRAGLLTERAQKAAPASAPQAPGRLVPRRCKELLEQDTTCRCIKLVAASPRCDLSSMHTAAT